MSVPWAAAAPRLISGRSPTPPPPSSDKAGGPLTRDRESNAYAYAFTPHACKNNKYHVCETDTCGGTYSEDRFAGGCDANGCDYNPYRMGNHDFYGKGLQVDTSKKFTVVTQFKPDRLTQFFVQNGKKILAPAPTFEGISDTGDITPDFCTNQFKAFNDRDRFAEVGGFSQLNAALGVPMVLVMSIWDDVRAPLVPWCLARCIMMLTVSPALLQHALARLHLPPGEGGRARCCPWSLRTGHRCSVRSRS